MSYPPHGWGLGSKEIDLFLEGGIGGPLALLGRGTSRTETPQLEVAKQMERVEFLDPLFNPDTTFGGWGETMPGSPPGFLGGRRTFRLPPEEGAFQISNS